LPMDSRSTTEQRAGASRGRAVEPLVRESIFRMLPEERFGDAHYVGGYWTRKGEVEVDLIGAEEKARPRRVAFVGSIKWRERTPFGERDLGRIATRSPERTKVPSWSASPEGDSTSKAEADIAAACHIRLASGVFMFRTCSEPPTKEET
jgi:hypothetical protein